MFNFNEEIKKYKPSLEVDSIEDNVSEQNVEDLLDILKYTIQNKDKE